MTPRIKIVALGGEMFPNQPGTVVAFSGAFLQRDPKGAQALVDQVVKAVDLIRRGSRTELHRMSRRCSARVSSTAPRFGRR